MTYLLVPGAFKDPADDPSMTPTVWVGAIDERVDFARLFLESEGGRMGLNQPNAWQSWAARAHRLDYRRVPLPNLQPRTIYNLRLTDDAGRQLADAQITTLPDRLPVRGEKPFTVFLGSCFHVKRDPGLTVGGTFLRLPAAVRPEMKFLCGDQVYLDAPWQHFAATRHSVEELKTELFETYKDTWTQGPRGFGDLLKSGATYFSSDDHEYWNNAPDRAPLVRDTYWPFGNRRLDWLRIARELFNAFQTPDLVSTFNVGPLSFINLDTRYAREADQSAFMTDANLRKVRRWVNGLRGPGVMVVGQPLLASRSGFFGLVGQFSDWSLADFEQYRDLIQILAASRQDIVILTGDVHYGRIATCTLASGVRLIEVISSPMALVDDAAGHSWNPPPNSFPDFDVPFVVRSRNIEVEREFNYSDNQFMTLEFYANGATVRMGVKAWPVTGGQPPFRPVFERELSLGIGAIV